MDYPEWISIIYELQKSWLCSNMLILWSDSAFHSRVETQVQDILTMTLYKILNARSCFSSVQSLSCVRLFAAPWIAACQAFLSITSSWSLLKLKSIESVMPSNHLNLCLPLLLPSQQQGLFQWVSTSHQLVKVLELQLQHQSFQWIFRTDFL